MIALLQRSRTSTGTAAMIGVALGFVVVGTYIGAGLLVSDWNMSGFLSNLSLERFGYFVAMTGLTVAVIGLPVIGFLRFDLAAPILVLMLVFLAWLLIGVLQGLLSLKSGFGLALFAAFFSPFYLVLYGILGGSEYLLRSRSIRL